MTSPNANGQGQQQAPDPIVSVVNSVPGLDDVGKEKLYDSLYTLRTKNDKTNGQRALQDAIQPLEIAEGDKEKLYDAAFNLLPEGRIPEQNPDLVLGSNSNNPSGSPIQPYHGSYGKQAFNIAEDIAYPSIGAAIGGAIATPADLAAGPVPTIAGATLGAMAGRSLENTIRSLTGREDLVPQTAKETAIDQAAAGAGGALQGAGKVLAKPVGSVTSQLASDAQDFNVPLSPGQKYGGGTALLENFLRKAAGSRDIITERLDKPTNNALVTAMDDLIDQVSKTKNLDLHSAGQFIDEAIRTAKDVAGKAYGDALQQIGAQGADQKLLDTSAQSDIVYKAKQLLNRLTQNSDFSVPDPARDKVIQIAQDFSNPTMEVNTGLVDASGKPVIRQVQKQLTWGDARKLNQSLADLAFSGEMTLQKQALSELRYAIKDEMGRTLGNGPLATAFKQASDHYAQTQDLLDQTIIKRLMDNGKPELVARQLLSGGAGESNAETLRQMIGPQNMSVMKGAVLKQMFDSAMDSSSTEDSLVGTKLLQQWNKIGPDAQHAIFNDPAQEAQIEKFVNLAAQAAPKASTLANGVSTTQGLAFGAGLYKMGRSVLTLSATGALAALTDMGAVYLTPRALATMLTSPGGAELLNKALSTPLGGRSAAYIGSKLAYMADAYYERQRGDTGVEHPAMQTK